MRTLVRAIALLLMSIPFAGIARADAGAEFFAAWGTAQQTLATATVSSATVRMIARPGLSGDQIRVRLDNTFGQTPLVIGAAAIGRRATGATLFAGANRQLAFGGQTAVTIPAGAGVYSDPVALDVVAGEDVAVSIYVPDLLVRPSSHNAGFVTSYLTAPLAGDHTLDEAGTPFTSTTTAIYWLAGIDVRSSATGVIVGLGASATDGTCGARVDQYERWTDVFARRLQALPAHHVKSIVNAGIAGNRLTPPGGTGPSGLDRLDRDVLQRTGVTHLVLAHGSNDLAGGATAEQVIAGMQQVIDRAHAQAVMVVAATIYSRNGFSAAQNAARHAVNDWVRNSGVADEVFDLDEMFKDPANPDRINPEYDCDGIHPNTAGYALWANSLDLVFFTPPPALPDLTPSSTLLTAERVSGADEVTVSATVVNGGPGAAANVKVRFLVDGVPLGVDRTIANLGAGASATVTASQTWSARGANGLHRLEVRVDPDNAVAESDESNNTAARVFSVQGNKVE